MRNKTNILDFLNKKNFFSKIFNQFELNNYLKNKNVFLYCGFDPTENSLHIGHLLPIICLKHFQNFGYTPIILIGGATSIVGDPSFKIYERKKQSLDLLRFNQICLEKQLLFFFNNQECLNNKVIILNNYSWFKNFSILSFLRKIGIYFSVNYMIHKESVKKRLIKEKTGMSFTEFSYSLLQAYDFLKLYEKYGVKLQIGGSDQWGNILSGIRLIKKLYKDDVFGATNSLLVKSNGEKFGKTETDTIWLDAKKTSPFKFYQFWVNISDEDIDNFLQWFTFIDEKKINILFHDNNFIKNIINKKIFLAEFLTKLVHGKDVLISVKRIIFFLFGNGSITNIKEEDCIQLLKDGIPSIICNSFLDLPHILVKTLLVNSLNKARNMIISGAIKINGIVQTQKDYNFSKSDLLFNKYTFISKGKKNYFLIYWKI
ncbi:tyrosine--tRNA ligase [Buchnera aphidicola]|uniref:Tyrosine--tRNA ligase n=1 Tax=Buchnera aphidicola subsp. Cinara cedri (strain Cc) TaxID=372461 RepID=Q057Z7_BUCCC|nr:tyrosine--tRNA ligase [Buchnera aphidicola]ABJ90552.1 tyrosyl-tRNA synthetase [Buchnera aphidicola BCc]